MPGDAGESVGELTGGMAAGDPAAIETFYRRYFDDLFQMARRATGRDEQFCLDIVQDSVLRIVRLVRRVDGEPQLRAWLKIVVHSTAYDLLRAERRRAGRERASVPASADRPFDEDQLEWLRGQLAKLDPELVEIIEMRFERRWTLRRIAETMGLTVGSVDGQLRRALARLRRTIDR